MILYHGTHIQGIKTLKPFSTPQNAISKSVICFTPCPYIALFYIWNRSYKWVTFNADENNKVVFTENYEGMLYDFYHNVSGSLYECNGDNPTIIQTHMKGVFISDAPVEIEKETVIPNVYDEILKQEALENIIVKRYSQLSSEEKAHILKKTIIAIHRQKLLFPTEHQPTIAQREFVKSHFPEAWSIASQMTKPEIDKMVNEWKAYLESKRYSIS